jgi:hypothetical protein
LMIMYSIKFPSSDHSVESQSCKLQLLNWSDSRALSDLDRCTGGQKRRM